MTTSFGIKKQLNVLDIRAASGFLLSVTATPLFGFPVLLLFTAEQQRKSPVRSTSVVTQNDVCHWARREAVVITRIPIKWWQLDTPCGTVTVCEGEGPPKPTCTVNARCVTFLRLSSVYNVSTKQASTTSKLRCTVLLYSTPIPPFGGTDRIAS